MLINGAFYSNVYLSKFSHDKMTSEISNIYLSADNLILFGDYNINILEETGKQLLNNFIADDGLEYVNTKKPTWTKRGKNFLIDQKLIFKIQFLKQTIESILEKDDFTFFYISQNWY